MRSSYNKGMIVDKKAIIFTKKYLTNIFLLYTLNDLVHINLVSHATDLKIYSISSMISSCKGPLSTRTLALV